MTSDIAIPACSASQGRAVEKLARGWCSAPVHAATLDSQVQQNGVEDRLGE
jgi:hypothetical protein